MASFARVSISALEGNGWKKGDANSMKDSLLEILICPGCRGSFELHANEQKPDGEIEHRS